MSGRTPFPTEKYAKLELLDNQYVLEDNTIIGVLDDFFPIAIGDYDLSPEEIEPLIKRGIIVPGFDDFKPNKQGIPVQTFYLDGYPEDSVIIDVFNLVYYKNICIGKWFNGQMREPSKSNLERLDELGIESKFLYGHDRSFLKVIIHNHIVQHYRPLPCVGDISLNDNVLAIQIDNSYYILGQRTNDGVKPLSEELLDKYLELGFKLHTDDITMSGHEVSVVPLGDHFRDIKYDFIVEQVGEEIKAIGMFKGSQVVPLSDFNKRLAKIIGYILD